MRFSSNILVKGAIWTIGSYGAVTVLRTVQSIVLAKFLSPDLFGLVLIGYTLRTGLELISDLGIGQNIVYSKNADDPEFYNTAWTLQLIRSVALWLLFWTISAPVARFYQSDTLLIILPFTGLTLLIGGFISISRSLLQKRLRVVRLNLFELATTFVGVAGQIIIAYFDRTVWAFLYGGLFGSMFYTVASYFLIPGLRQRFYISRKYTMEIIHFGKWIFVSSIVYFLSVNFDRLYLAKVVPLNLLGVYGIARSISELLGGLVARLSNYVLFPFIASHTQMPRAQLHQQLSPLRMQFLLLVAVGLSIFVAFADLAVKILYDQRYYAAAWMLPVLTIGSWFSILANVNESTLLGLGRPSYSAYSNGLKCLFLVVGLPIGVGVLGLIGGVTVVTAADAFRYFPILVGQRREQFSYGRQDLLITFAMLSLVTLWEVIRWSFGFGTSFNSLPLRTLFHGS